jgi:hypothetical protein
MKEARRAMIKIGKLNGTGAICRTGARHFGNWFFNFLPMVYAVTVLAIF